MADKFKSLQGQLLLDGGNLGGSYFHRTVVLICQHSRDGAFGLVLNRSSKTTVGDALVAKLPGTLKEQMLYLGGPVQPSTLSFLHASGDLADANVLPNLSVGHDLDELVEVGEHLSPESQVRIFAGYAGWSPGQLDDEMRRKSWLVHPASLELIFSAAPEELWAGILKQMGWRYRLISQGPSDLSWN